MHDVFISYSSADDRLANFLFRHLKAEGLNPFLASLSLVPGQKWSHEIRSALNSSPWVVFLASRAACASPWVQQEIGAALAAQKKLVPIVWDLPPTQLPGWVSQYQALDLAGATQADAERRISAIAERIKADKTKGQMIAVFALAGLLLVLSGKG